MCAILSDRDDVAVIASSECKPFFCEVSEKKVFVYKFPLCATLSDRDDDAVIASSKCKPVIIQVFVRLSETAAGRLALFTNVPYTTPPPVSHGPGVIRSLIL